MPGTLAARILAVLAPALILSAGLWGIAQVRDQKDVRAERDAGAVMAGGHRFEGTTAYIESRMSEEPEVVVVGDSLGHADLHLPTLARTLGLPERAIAELSIPASIGAHWQAILQHHVLDRGHRPRLLLVVATLRSMIETTPSSPAVWENLDALLPETGADEIRARAGRRRGLRAIGRILVNRVKLRRRLLDDLRAASVALVHRPGRPADASALERGEARAQSASQRVFDRRQLDLGLTQQVHGVVDARVWGQDDPRLLPAPEDSFLPVLFETAAAAGIKVVLVRPPLSPAMPEEGRDTVLPSTPDAVGTLARAHGARFLDLSELDVAGHMYRDLAHMGPRAAMRFSAILGARLRMLDAASPDPALWQPPDAEILLRPDGLDLESPWTAPERAFSVRVAVRGEHPRVRLGDHELQPLEDAPSGIRRFQDPGPPPDPPAALTVEGASELLAIGLGQDGADLWPVGSAEIWRGPTIRVLEAAERRFERPPPELALGAPEPGPARTLFWSIPQVAPVLDRIVGRGLAVPAGCFLLDVRSDGRPLPDVEIGCRGLLLGAAPGACFDGVRLYARPPRRDDTARLSLEVDPERGCGGWVWLYPGDVLTLDLPEDSARALPGGPRHLGVEAFSDGPVALEIALSPGEESFLWRSPPSTASLDRPLREPRDITTIRIRNRSRTHLVVLSELNLHSDTVPQPTSTRSP